MLFLHINLMNLLPCVTLKIQISFLLPLTPQPVSSPLPHQASPVPGTGMVPVPGTGPLHGYFGA